MLFYAFVHFENHFSNKLFDFKGRITWANIVLVFLKCAKFWACFGYMLHATVIFHVATLFVTLFTKTAPFADKLTQNARILRLLIRKWCSFWKGHDTQVRLQNNVKYDISEGDFAYDVEAYCTRYREVQKQQKKQPKRC